MIPGGVLSSSPHPAAFAEKVNQRDFPLVDYEMGGVALQNPNSGLLVRLWAVRCIDGHSVTIDAEGVETVTLFTRSGTVQLVSLAFDQNMTPHVAFVEDGVAWLWWWDSIANAMRFDSFAGMVTPRLCLDEKRAWNLAASDVTLCYIKDGKLCQRLQRDRFGTEVVLDPGPFSTLASIGRNTGDRMQYALTPG